MEFKIFHYGNKQWYISIRGDHQHKDDSYQAQLLNLSYEDYKTILIQCGAHVYEKYSGDCFFKTKRDAQWATKVLEPYLILASLTE